MRKDIVKGSLVLFSMMFGAGNIIFPVLLGEYAGAFAPIALLGFLFAGVAVPIIGFVAMMLYGGDYKEFFGRIGKKPGFALFALLIALLGPIGAIPRLITISYATISPYIPWIGPTLFSLLACLGTFLFVMRKSRVFSILAYVLTPILLGSLAIIIGKGLFSPGEAVATVHTAKESLFQGLSLGYSLLDLIAAFLYATVLLNVFRKNCKTPKELISRTVWSMIIGGGLLAASYAGLLYVGVFHAAGGSEEVLRTISLKMLGPLGGLVACVAVSMACLTTAISLVTVCSNFLRDDVLKGKGGYLTPIVITLGISFGVSTLGFTGIANMIGPILEWIHPGLILLCLINIAYKVAQRRKPLLDKPPAVEYN